jgi:hypothetical protein
MQLVPLHRGLDLSSIRSSRFGGGDHHNYHQQHGGGGEPNNFDDYGHPIPEYARFTFGGGKREEGGGLTGAAMSDRALAAAAVSGMAAVTSTAFCGGKEAAPAVRKNLRDRDFVASILAELHGVDAEDPRIACVMGAVTADPKPQTANAATAPPPPVGSSSGGGGGGGGRGGRITTPNNRGLGSRGGGVGGASAGDGGGGHGGAVQAECSCPIA